MSDSQPNYTTFAQLQANVLSVFKRTDKTTELKLAINEAYEEMTGIVGPRKAQDQIYKQVVLRREEYPIPDTILRLNHPIRLIDPTADTNNSSSHHPLEFISKEEYDIREPNPNAATIVPSRPSAYCVYKNSILLTPLPDKLYKLELNVGGQITRLVEAGDMTIFNPIWDETIKAGALARLYLGIGLKDSADVWQSVYRYGFAGKEENVTGGLGLLIKLHDAMMHAPVIVQPRDF